MILTGMAGDRREIRLTGRPSGVRRRADGYWEVACVFSEVLAEEPGWWEERRAAPDP
jgi:hypothetical protein